MGVSLVITHIFSPSIVLVLNAMVLVIVIESFFASEHEQEHRLTTEHEHEITNKSNESPRNKWGNVGNDKGR